MKWPHPDSEYSHPEVSGYFWWRAGPDRCPYIKHVLHVDGALCAAWSGVWVDVKTVGGEWTGPIPEPEECDGGI